MKIKRTDYIFDMLELEPKQMVEVETGLRERLKRIKDKEALEHSAETIREILAKIEEIKNINTN